MAEAYKALPGYADEGTVTLSFTAAGQDESQTIAKPFAFARPNRLVVSQEPAAFHLDGRQQVSEIAGLYLVSDAPEAITATVLARDPAASYIFGGITGIPSVTLFRLLASDDPYTTILQGVERLEREPERAVNGVECRSLKIVPEAGPVVRLLIDPESFLIRRIEIVPSVQGLPDDLEVKEISWSSGPISVEIPPEDRFTHAPPDDARQVQSIAALMAGPDGEEPGSSLLNKPAPDFSLDLLADDATIERMTRESLAGKVVLIDVWATWCDPCEPELNAVDALLDHFADRPGTDRLRVISLSVDSLSPSVDDDEEQPKTDARRVAEVRQLVERFLDGKSLNLDRPPIARVAIDPKGNTTKVLGIEAIPMLILIDPTGTVRAVHVGAPPRVIRELIPTIEGMLDDSQPASSSGSED